MKAMTLLFSILVLLMISEKISVCGDVCGMIDANVKVEITKFKEKGFNTVRDILTFGGGDQAGIICNLKKFCSNSTNWDGQTLTCYRGAGGYCNFSGDFKVADCSGARIVE